MDSGTASHYDDSNDINDISRRGSKRRRMIEHRNAEDPTHPELGWPGTQQQHQQQVLQQLHAPNSYTATTRAPSRMDESFGVVPAYTPSATGVQPLLADPNCWSAQQRQVSNSFVPYAGQQVSHQPYFQQQPSSIEPYSSIWPAGAQATYDTTNHSFSDSRSDTGAQYLSQAGASEPIYDASISGSYTGGTIYSNVGPSGVPTTSYASTSTSTPYSSSQNFQTLDSTATQIILTVAQHSYIQFREMLENTSTASQKYFTTKNIFDQTRRLIAGDSAFIGSTLAQHFSQDQQEIIQKANIATFITSVLDPQNIPFTQLDQAFLEVFMPLGHRLLKWQGAIYLELKTQTYIVALLNSDSPPTTLLDEYFSPDMESHILQRHSDAPSLSPSEQDFVDRCKARRQYLLAESYAYDTRNDLPRKYQWLDFVREFSSCISKNVDHVLSVHHRQAATQGATSTRRRAGSGPGAYTPAAHEAAAQASTSVSRSLSNGGHAQQQQHSERKTLSNGQTVRQAWTKSEEEALIAGLERVGGPHWSQILALYGRGGSMNEVLKDRNQVQLKDKARNLKLWYLKMGQEVPMSLRGVTGELRKRGGARARAALEAEEQGAARKSSDDAEHEETDLMLGIRHDTVDPGASDRQKAR